MKPLLTIFSAVAALLCCQSCYVAKPLDRDVRISITTDFPITIKNEGNSNFSTRHTEAEYRKQYINDMMAEFANDPSSSIRQRPSSWLRLLHLN